MLNGSEQARAGRTFLRVPTLFFALVAAPLAAASPSGPSVNTTRNWASYGHDPSEQHFSPLRQIGTANVGRLGLLWYRDVDAKPSAFSAPLAVDGILYYGAGYSVLYAVDARSGRLLWRYDPKVYEVAGERMRSGWGIRGIAYADGRIFTGTLDGRLIAVDAHRGKPLWSVSTVEPGDGRYITGPPWVFNGKVAIGHGGGDFAPFRGYVTAYDQRTGQQRWRFHTVPGDPAKGFESKAMELAAKTWSGEPWKAGGGGAVWHAMAYDRRFNRLYIGTGNGAPWNERSRSPGGGDNLFLASIVALDADTGEYAWHYQLTPGDVWDYDADVDIEFADLKIAGRTRPVLMQASKNGFFYVLDRETGKLVSAEKFVPKANWAERIDLATGRPVESEDARFGRGPRIVYPSPVGGHSVEAMSYSPVTRLAYVPAVEQGYVYSDPSGGAQAWRFTPGQVINNAIGSPPPSLTVPPGTNALLAWDPRAQRPAWSVPLPGTKNGGTLATAGNLVFQGNVLGELVAYAADSGKRLWSFDAQTGIMAQPITYLVGARQYVSVMTGWRLSAPSGPGLAWDYVSQKRRVLTFVLGGNASLPPSDRTPRPFVEDPGFELDAAKVAIGAAVFGRHCGLCHGPGLNSGGAAPDLRRSSIALSQDALAAVLHDGALVANGMPRFAEFSDAEIDGLRHYIRRQTRAAIAASVDARSERVQ